MSSCKAKHKEVGMVMKMWRLSNILYRAKVPILPGLLTRIIRLIFSCDIPYRTKIGKGVIFAHNALGVVVNEEAVIGDNVKILQHVSIAGRRDHGVPVIEDNVFIGANVVIMGGVRIGKGAKIGASALVITDIPAGATAVGVPAKIICR